MAVTQSLISMLVVCVCSFGYGEAQSGVIMSVARKRNGDVYTERSRVTGICENKNCSRQKPTLGPDGICHSDLSLRNRHCSSNATGQFFLSANLNLLEIFAIIGNNGILNVFNNESGNYENGKIVNKNIISNITEVQSGRGGCSITSVEDIQSLQLIKPINSSGFSVHANASAVLIQINEVNLASSRENYDGRIFRLNISCANNEKLDCIVIKLNGTSDYNPGFNQTCLETPTITSGPSIVTFEIITASITSFWQDPILQKIFIGSGCVIGVLIILLIILGVGICTMFMKSKKFRTIISRRMKLQRDTMEVDLNDDNIEMKENSSYAVVEMQNKQSNKCHVYDYIII